MCNLHIVEIGFRMNQSGKRESSITNKLTWSRFENTSGKSESMSFKHFILPVTSVLLELKRRTVLLQVSHLKLFIFQS